MRYYVNDQDEQDQYRSSSSVEGSAALAKAYYGAEDFGEAAKAARRSLDLDSNSTDMWRIYAHSLAEKKEYAAALPAFTIPSARSFYCR